MGWSSGTEYFDKPLDLFLKYVPEGERAPLVRELYDLICEGDWDTTDESKYYIDYIAHFEYEDEVISLEEYREIIGYPSP